MFAILINLSEGAYLMGPFDNEPEALGARDDLIRDEFEATFDMDEQEAPEFDREQVIDEIATQFTVLQMTKDGNWEPGILRPIPLPVY